MIILRIGYSTLLIWIAIWTFLIPTVPSSTSPNGKKCYTCIGQNCTGTLNCSGDEDHCISAEGNRPMASDDQLSAITEIFHIDVSSPGKALSPGNNNVFVFTVKVAGQDIIMKGCASSTLCLHVPAAQMAGGMSSDMSCCRGNLCNNARSTGFSLLLLVASVTSVVLFH